MHGQRCSLNKRDIEVGCWVRVLWTDCVDVGILVSYYPSDREIVVFTPSDGQLHRLDDVDQIVDIGDKVALPKDQNHLKVSKPFEEEELARKWSGKL